MEIGDYFTFEPAKDIPVHNWFYYKEAYSPQLVEWALGELGVVGAETGWRKPGFCHGGISEDSASLRSSEAELSPQRYGWRNPAGVRQLSQERYGNGKLETVFDPFCGIGTTMLYAKENGMRGIGIDVSPLALFVAKTKCADYSEKDAEEAEKELKGLFSGRRDGGIPRNSASYRRANFPEGKWRPFSQQRKSGSDMEAGWNWDFELFHPSRFFGKRNYNDICYLRERVEKIENEKVGALFLLALLSILPQTGFFIKDGGVLREEPKKSAMPVKDAFKRKVKRMVKDLRAGRVGGKEPELMLKDARDFSEAKADAFVTSPPYLNNIDYSKVYGLELSLLTMQKESTKIMRGREVRGFITGESFAECPPEAEEFADIPIAGTYFADMEKVLRNLKKIAPCGCMVVGNSVLGGKHIPVDEILIRIGERVGFSGRIAVVKGRVADVRPGRMRVRESAVLFG